ncbi:MAG: vWA domain-containing protein [Rikenellaceae bacterium]
MAYTNTITREHRSAYVLLLDVSGSMQDVIESQGRKMTKGESMVNAANQILQELFLRAHRDNELRDYYDVAVIGYAGGEIRSLLGDGSKVFTPITELYEESNSWISLKCLTPLNAPDEVYHRSIVVDSMGSTPMHEVLYVTYGLLREWCDRPENYDSAPPMVFHITDGHATDGDLRDIIEISEQVMSLSTNDGNVLMLNIHLSPMMESQKLLFPTESELAAHPNAFFRTMGLASSVMPQSFTPLIHEMRGRRSNESYRGVGFNVSVVDMISMMNIGTLSVPVR